MLFASSRIGFAPMARICVSLPEELVNDLKLKKPKHIGLSTHIRGLIYKALEQEEMGKFVAQVAAEERAVIEGRNA